jgi:hypothetical protein
MHMLGEQTRDRIRWSGRGLIVGLVVGLILGWILHGVIGWIFRVGFILMVLAFFGAALYFWLSTRRGGRSGGTITVREATWRDLDGPGGDRP